MKNSKKLKLNREALKTLNSTQLEKAGGALGSFTSSALSCNGSTLSCTTNICL